MQINIEDVALSNVFSHIKSLFNAQAEAKGLSFEVPLNQLDTKLCQSDPIRLTQIISNLVSNSVKYTQKGLVKLESKIKGEFLDIVVTDTGEGIADVETVTKAFHQEIREAEEAFEGIGLGLEIVEKLCKVLGHKLSIQSTLGVGTVVTVTVPCSVIEEIAPDYSAIPSYDAKENFSNLSVLIVDDNEINREIARDTLKDIIDNVACAENGRQAVSMVAEASGYDIVLMDLNMPVKNGYEASREIKALSNLKTATRIIALTADAYGEIQQRCLKAGMSQHLAKPYTRESLVSVVTQPEFNNLVRL